MVKHKFNYDTKLTKPQTVPCPICTCWKYDSSEPEYDFPRILLHIKKGILHSECSEYFLNQYELIKK